MEEILYKVHELGLFDEFFEEVKEVRKQLGNKSREDIYEIALENLLKKKLNQGIDFNKK